MILAKRRRRCAFSERMKKTRSQTQTAAGLRLGHVAEAENPGRLHADTTPKISRIPQRGSFVSSVEMPRFSVSRGHSIVEGASGVGIGRCMYHTMMAYTAV